jgi:hypothetical protein
MGHYRGEGGIVSDLKGDIVTLKQGRKEVQLEMESNRLMSFNEKAAPLAAMGQMPEKPRMFGDCGSRKADSGRLAAEVQPFVVPRNRVAEGIHPTAWASASSSHLRMRSFGAQDSPQYSTKRPSSIVAAAATIAGSSNLSARSMYSPPLLSFLGGATDPAEKRSHA